MFDFSLLIGLWCCLIAVVLCGCAWLFGWFYGYGCLCLWLFMYVVFWLCDVCGCLVFAAWLAWWCFGLCEPFCLVLGAVWLITCGVALLVSLFADGLRL